MCSVLLIAISCIKKKKSYLFINFLTIFVLKKPFDQFVDDYVDCNHL